MPHNKRHVDPDRYYFLTNRTQEGTFLFRPDAECNRIIAGVLARCVEQHDVELVCFVFMSNHFHLIARFPDSNMSAFMRDLQSQIADRVNTIRGDRSGTVFPKPFDDQVLIGADVLLDKISYVLNNPVKDGLVCCPRDWPGVTSYGCHSDEKNFVGKWFDANKWHNLKRRKSVHSKEEALREYRVQLHVPTSLPGDTPTARVKKILTRIEEDRVKFRRNRSVKRRQTPGPEAVKRTSWQKKSKLSKARRKKRRRLCVASSVDAIESHREKRRRINERYKEALKRWYEGEPVSFPVGTHPPGSNQCTTANRTPIQPGNNGEPPDREHLAA